MSDNAPRVVVGMSGGVDSAVTALLLRRAGYDVHGVFMKNWDDPDAPECTAAADLEDARRVCERLEIPLHKVSFVETYRERVFAHFLAEYRAGRTPNPDVLCNKEIKFAAFLDHAETLGAERVATGHYARLVRRDGYTALYQGVDAGKDQSYFLYALGQRALTRAVFPLGYLHKAQVRRLAREAGLPNHAKKDSTGICFIGERDFRAFLSRFLPAQPGPIRTPEGETLGTHQGLMFYTLGQRQGLGLGGRRDASGAPWYVVGKDLGENTLLVGQGHDHPLLYARRLEAGSLNWIDAEPLQAPRRCTAKIRYRQTAAPCRLEPVSQDRWRVTFDAPQWAVTEGQSVVFYDGMRCLGGGVIEAVDRPGAISDIADGFAAQAVAHAE